MAALNPSVSDATVYGLTEAGREFLEAHNLLAAEGTLQRIYGTIADKPEKMVTYENTPRPDDG